MWICYTPSTKPWVATFLLWLWRWLNPRCLHGKQHIFTHLLGMFGIALGLLYLEKVISFLHATSQANQYERSKISLSFLFHTCTLKKCILETARQADGLLLMSNLCSHSTTKVTEMISFRFMYLSLLLLLLYHWEVDGCLVIVIVVVTSAAILWWRGRLMPRYNVAIPVVFFFF